MISLSLFIIPDFVSSIEVRIDAEYEEWDKKRFNNLCGAVFVDNTSIKNIRIKYDNNINDYRHVSSPLVVYLIQYMKKIKDWRKLDSFQYISDKRLDTLFFKEHGDTADLVKENVILSNTQRKIRTPDDFEEFYLLDNTKDMVQNEIAISFKDIGANESTEYKLRALERYCKRDDRKYKIKVKENKFNRDGQRVVIDIDIGVWDDKVHNDDKRQFDC